MCVEMLIEEFEIIAMHLTIHSPFTLEIIVEFSQFRNVSFQSSSRSHRHLKNTHRHPLSSIDADGDDERLIHWKETRLSREIRHSSWWWWLAGRDVC